jgi:hypothetical protein
MTFKSKQLCFSTFHEQVVINGPQHFAATKAGMAEFQRTQFFSLKISPCSDCLSQQTLLENDSFLKGTITIFWH